jgi:hypothetical protein
LRYLLATRPEVITQVLSIVFRAISGHLIRQAGLTRAGAVTGAVTLIQRFGSALNLNVHFHLLVLDGVYRRDDEGVSCSSRSRPRARIRSSNWCSGSPRGSAARVGRALERAGLITHNIENVFAIDIETCRQCGGRLRVIARIEPPALIERILGHLGRAAGAVDPAHPSRAPPGCPRLI